jgi:hypothetical protein
MSLSGQLLSGDKDIKQAVCYWKLRYYGKCSLKYRKSGHENVILQFGCGHTYNYKRFSGLSRRHPILTPFIAGSNNLSI